MEDNDADEAPSAIVTDKGGDGARPEGGVQVRLASMPLDDEFERLRAELAAAKARLVATAAEIPSLKSLIESTDHAVAARQAEAGEKQAAAEELRRRVDRGRAELRRLRAEVAAAWGAKDSLERRVLVRRQATCALQLAERAVAAEAHALVWSAGAAAEQAARARGDGDDAADHDVVTLPARRLEEWRRAVETEERKAVERVEEAEAQRRAAKARRTAAVARLDAARAKRREADEELSRRLDRGDDGHGKGARRVPSPRSRNGRSCFTVKKLRSILCGTVARA